MQSCNINLNTIKTAKLSTTSAVNGTNILFGGVGIVTPCLVAGGFYVLLLTNSC